MRLAEIEVGRYYWVKIPESVDYTTQQQANRGEVIARVEEVGVPYTVTSYSGSRVRGDRGYRRHRDSARPDGVRITYADQEVPGRYQDRVHIFPGAGIVRPGSVVCVAAEEDTIEGGSK